MLDHQFATAGANLDPYSAPLGRGESGAGALLGRIEECGKAGEHQFRFVADDGSGMIQWNLPPGDTQQTTSSPAARAPPRAGTGAATGRATSARRSVWRRRSGDVPGAGRTPACGPGSGTSIITVDVHHAARYYFIGDDQVVQVCRHGSLVRAATGGSLCQHRARGAANVETARFGTTYRRPARTTGKPPGAAEGRSRRPVEHARE